MTSLSNRPHATGNSPVADEFSRRWRAKRRADRLRGLLSGGVLLLALAGSMRLGEVDPARLMHGLPAFFDYIHRILPDLGADRPLAGVADWYWNITGWLKLILDTAAMAFLGTVFGGLAAFCLSFLAARNLAPNGALAFVVRRFLELCRTVPELVFALVFVFAFGLGPIAGILAISIHTAGSLGKLFAEACENVSGRSPEGVRASGGSWFEVMRFGVLPQVMPTFASYWLLRFEINVRAASVIGLVGAGGIGQELYFVIRQFIYTDISAIILLITATVIVTDMLCERLRMRLIHGDPANMSAQARQPDSIRAELSRSLIGKQLRSALLLAAFILLLVLASIHLDLSFAQFWNGLAHLGALMGAFLPPDDGGYLGTFLFGALETLAMAFLGTLLAALLALPIGFLAARNVVSNPVAHFAVRRMLDMLRGVDVLIWALLFVSAVGLGPFAGILAIAASDLGTLAKLFSESIENADKRQVEGTRAVGAGQLEVVRFGLIPQVLPVLTSHVLYFFESNTRSAAILGIVGAGGIGLHLADRIRVHEWQQVSVILIILIVLVATIDAASRALRHALIKGAANTDRGVRHA